MWPWEHAAVGYVVYSVLARLGHDPPDDAAAVAVVLGTQFPDLVDKPLAWWLDALPAGRSLAHSLLFALPAVLLVLVLAGLVRRTDVGAAFGIGYLSHLPGDVIYPLAYGDGLATDFLLYPLTEVDPSSTTSLFEKAGELFVQFLAFLATPRGQLYLLAEVALVTVAFALWWSDGFPGLGPFRRRMRHALAG